VASIERRVRQTSKGPRTTYSVRYRDPAGRLRRKVFARRVDAERWIVEFNAARLRGQFIDPRLGRTRLVDLAERWWATTVDLKPSTRRLYRQLLDGHVLPGLAVPRSVPSIAWWLSNGCRANSPAA
jgi:hypothetical protein